MKFIKFNRLTTLLYILLLIDLTVTKKEADFFLKRGKRYLDFLQKSRVFFRVNVKDNVIKVNTLWAQAFGFRANYPIENDRKYRPFRRDVVDTMEELITRSGLDGHACTLKAFCTAMHIMAHNSGLVFKLFKLIFTLEESDLAQFPHIDKKYCGQAEHTCPLTFKNISPYTDEF